MKRIINTGIFSDKNKVSDDSEIYEAVLIGDVKKNVIIINKMFFEYDINKMQITRKKVNKDDILTLEILKYKKYKN